MRLPWLLESVASCNKHQGAELSGTYHPGKVQEFCVAERGELQAVLISVVLQHAVLSARW